MLASQLDLVILSPGVPETPLIVVGAGSDRRHVFFRKERVDRYLQAMSTCNLLLYCTIDQGKRCPAFPWVLPFNTSLDGGM